jgi:signal peptidase II
MSLSRNARHFWPVLGVVLLADCYTKDLAANLLVPAYTPHDVVGSWMRFTLAYNPRGAMSFDLGPGSNLILCAVAVVALLALHQLYRRAAPQATLYVCALALVAGGALGNLADRLRSQRGVIDFIDIGYGATRFWTFNVADAAITTGALILAWRLSRVATPDVHA